MPQNIGLIVPRDPNRTLTLLHSELISGAHKARRTCRYNAGEKLVVCHLRWFMARGGPLQRSKSRKPDIAGFSSENKTGETFFFAVKCQP